MTRGYIIAKKDSKIVNSVKDIKKDDILNLTLCDGEKKAKVL